MKILISPAKLMNIKNTTSFLKRSVPHFIQDSKIIQTHLREKSPKFLSELMEISPKLADENWERNQKWTDQPRKEESTFAMFAFTGEVYRGLEANSLDKNAVKYLQKNLRMLSGLYGILKPSDEIMLYRLEMGCGFSFEKYQNLYDFWGNKVTEHLNKELTRNDFVLNLASNEYGKVIQRKKLNAKIIDVDFKEIKDGKLKTIVVYTKHARGLLAKFCAEKNAKSLNDVKAFNYEGYFIDEKNSTENQLLFVR